jgi:hypothetical protein
VSSVTAISEDPRHVKSYVDAEGQPTDDPARAVRGEMVDLDSESKPVRRTWFRLEEVELKWLPIRESAFLLWVLALLLVVWLGIGVALGLV